MPKKLNPSYLDPGIRKVVLFLRENGFDTCDSGDGISKGRKGIPDDCFAPFPHVHCQIDSKAMVEESKRMMGIITSVSKDMFTRAYWKAGGPTHRPRVEASYSPVDDIAILSLFCVDDDMLFPT